MHKVSCKKNHKLIKNIDRSNISMFKNPVDPLIKRGKIEAEDNAQANDVLETKIFPETCRICLNEGEIAIFGEPSICKDIIEFGCIIISENDGFPQHICKQCHKLLENAINFRTIAMESEYILRQNIKTEESEADEFSDTNSNTADSESLNIDQNSDIHCSYLEYDSLEYELDTSPSHKDVCSSIEDEETAVDPKDMYMIIVSDSKNSRDVTFKCELCNLTLTTIDEVNAHLLTHESETCIKCEICNNILDINLYEIHIKLHREDFKRRKVNKKVQCKLCGKTVNTTYIKMHMKMHGTYKDKSERLKHCTICDKALSSNYFNDHMNHIHGKTQKPQEKIKKCPLCDRSFKESFYMKHVASHSNLPKKLICEQCGKEFRHSSGFNTHVLTHGADLKYKCQFCPYRGLHLGLLKVHVRTHTKDYTYKCSTCNKNFLTKSNLTMHERRHKPPDTFICQSCNKGFYTKRNLDKHYNMIHLGIRNEKCEICGKAFGHRDGVVSHMRKVHKCKGMTGQKGRLPNYLKAQAQQNKPKL